MTEKSEKRVYLDNWVKCKCKSKVDIIARKYPNCGCESAATAIGGHGPVGDDEQLRFFITSRSIIDIKKKKNLTAAIFKRIFKDGMSTVRLSCASKSEMFETAEELYRIHFTKDGDYGGIVGVVEFKTSEVRFDENQKQICCVLETPVGKKISHADIVSSMEKLDRAEQNRIRQLLFVKIGERNSLKKIESVDGGNLAVFTPRFNMNSNLH